MALYAWVEGEKYTEYGGARDIRSVCRSTFNGTLCRQCVTARVAKIKAAQAALGVCVCVWGGGR